MNNAHRSILILVLASLSVAFNWFGAPDQNSKKETPKKSETSVVTPNLNESKDEPKVIPVKQDESVAAESATRNPEIPKLPEIPNIPKAPTPIKPLVPPLIHPIPRSVPDPANIEQIQKQIKEIIQLNEQLKVSHQAQMVEIQKITEQARIHQRILADMEKSRQKQSASKPDLNLAIDQEKVRVIKSETEKNREYVKNLEQKS